MNILLIAFSLFFRGGLYQALRQIRPNRQSVALYKALNSLKFNEIDTNILLLDYIGYGLNLK